MFSLLGALLDQDLKSIAESLPVGRDIQLALTEQKGLLGDILSLVVSIEKADWHRVIELEQQLNLQGGAVSDAYQRSIRWTDEVFN
jgi:c-di-GMP-related signal transduction protein